MFTFLEHKYWKVQSLLYTWGGLFFNETQLPYFKDPWIEHSLAGYLAFFLFISCETASDVCVCESESLLLPWYVNNQLDIKV